MKIKLSLPLFTAALLLAAGSSWAQSGAKSAPVVSVEKNSFKEVTSQLDPGGNFFMFISSEQWLDGLSGKIAAWRGTLLDLVPEDGDLGRAKAGKLFDVVTSLIKDSGVEDISGIGISSIEKEKGMYHTKVVIHHYKGKGQGLIWNMSPATPHAMKGLDLLPATTVLAGFGDSDLSQLWKFIDSEVTKSGVPEAVAAMTQIPGGFAMVTGLKLEDVLASLGNEYGLIVTMDDTKKIKLPTPGMELEIPEPGIMLAIKVKNDMIFKRVDDMLKDNPMVTVRVDKDGLKMRTMQLPLPIPLPLRPTLALSGDYMFIATSETLVQDALDVQAGKKPGLKSTEEFKHVAAGMPELGNSFGFVSHRFQDAFAKIQEQTMKSAPQNSAVTTAMAKWQALVSQKVSQYNVATKTDEGVVSVSNSGQNPANVVLLVPVAAAGLVAAIAIPNFVHARSTSQQNACINNLRMIDGAKQQWALENKKGADATPEWSDVKPYMGRGAAGEIPVCPQGGKYTLGNIQTAPTCSIEGHKLN